jgi:hypothetical protein
MKPIDLHNCEIGSVASRKDGSVRFSVETAELTTDQRALVLGYHGKACRAVIAPSDYTDGEVEEIKTEKGDKTPSSRMRAVLFLLWRQDNQHKTFQEYYSARMERIIDKLKEQIIQ